MTGHAADNAIPLSPGIAALKSGRREEARAMLEDAVRADPRSLRAWLWLSGAVTADAERRYCLKRAVALDVEYAPALRGLEALGPGPARSPLDHEAAEAAEEEQRDAEAQRSRRARRAWHPVAWLRANPYPLALAYLLALTAAEFLTLNLDIQIGLWADSALLVALIAHTALIWRRPYYKLFLSLAIVPLVRLVSLTMPLGRFPLIYWYLNTSLPLLAAAAVVSGLVGFTPRRIGLWLRAPVWRSLPVQLAVGATGLLFGYLEYLLLRPEMAAPAARWTDLIVPALILLICTGFAEELIFRGVMQRSATEALGRWGLWYVSALFAMLHMGHASWLDIPFVFAVAAFFAWVTRRTGSIVGVTLSHGLTNIVLFLVMPAVVRGGL